VRSLSLRQEDERRDSIPCGRSEPRHCNEIDVKEMPLQSPGRGAAALNVFRIGARIRNERLAWNGIGFLLSLTIIAIAAMALVHILRGIKVHEVIAAMRRAHGDERCVRRRSVAHMDQSRCGVRDPGGAGIVHRLGMAAPARHWPPGVESDLPDGPLTLLQIGIGIVDLACCALAMCMLLWVEPNSGFVTLAVIFVAATLSGFASHAPGGIGVFDAAMLVALWQYDKHSYWRVCCCFASCIMSCRYCFRC
jgi:hypothetical protein